MSAICFHCGEPLAGATITARVGERSVAVCCSGCRAVAELIGDSGLEDFYRRRTKESARPSPLDSWTSYAKPEIAAQYIRIVDAAATVLLVVEGMRCSACGWLIEHAALDLPGVRACSINPTTGYMQVASHTGELDLVGLLRTIAQLGYRPRPLAVDSALDSQLPERRSALKHFIAATFGMMQVMMFAFAEYAAKLNGEQMDEQLHSYFRLVSLLVCTPVLFYAGGPFLRGAWHSVQARTISMDVPVTLALLLAYAASVWDSLTGTGEVYFDSITMFLFFLTLGRFIQMTLRHRTAALTEAIARQLPDYAHRIVGGDIQDVPVANLRIADTVLIRSGELCPADGVLTRGSASLDESLLTGESKPITRQAGGCVTAGSLNVGNPIEIRITAVGTQTTLAHIVDLLRRAQTQKPHLSAVANVAAARFLALVLLGAAATCVAWLAIDSTRAFAATLAVLVAACPCAFAIAMPAALSAATAQLARDGLLVTRPDAIEMLAGTTHLVFDKTGTLTRGDVALEDVVALADLGRQRCLDIAAALETASEHPIAHAFANVDVTQRPSDVRVITGGGIEGTIDGTRYRIGSSAFVHERLDAWRSGRLESAFTEVWLSDGKRDLAVFRLADSIRDSARRAIASLRAQDINVEILSGDTPAAVARVASQCGGVGSNSRCSPAEKLQHVQTLQRHGARVAMVGDGVNDAPVLGTANVSIAMGRGTALAQATSDMVMVAEDLDVVPRAVEVARRTLRIAKQNLVWSSAYNLAALPLAALGLTPPWVAALGMSLSSTFVILNAMRLLPRRSRTAEAMPSGASSMAGAATA